MHPACEKIFGTRYQHGGHFCNEKKEEFMQVEKEGLMSLNCKSQ